MQPRLTVLTLGVDDLDRAVAFYRDGLGFPTKGILGEAGDPGRVAFFDLQPGLKLALWPRSSLAGDTGLPIAPPATAGMSLARNVATRAEVDAEMARAERAGATIVKSAQSTFYGGYAGYFKDPEQHLWEIAFNPGWESL